MPYPPPKAPPVVVEIMIHFDSSAVARYERAGVGDQAAAPASDEKRPRDARLATVDAAGNIDLTRIYGPVVLRFRADPADHHRFDHAGALFTSDTPLAHTRRWRPDAQFRRVRLSDHGFTLSVDYQNINTRHGRPMPANGYDLAFEAMKRDRDDPAIRNSGVTP